MAVGLDAENMKILQLFLDTSIYYIPFNLTKSNIHQTYKCYYVSTFDASNEQINYLKSLAAYCDSS